jgi:diguanylate cyclase (GGDEF)-like protein/PAS domain S-box-containing protein
MDHQTPSEKAGSGPGPRDARHQPTSERRIVLGFVLAAGLILAVAAVSVLGISRLRDDGDRVAHTQLVISKLEDLVSLATNAETAGRGYAITGQAAYLEPYTEASLAMAFRLGQLGELVAGNQEQVRALATLSQLVAERLKLVRQLIDLRDKKGFEAARDFVIDGEGKRIHDAIRLQVDGMRQLEDTLLRERQADTGRSTRAALWSVALGSVLALAVVGAALSLIRRDYAGSRRAHAALRNLNAELDTKVARRTSELELANERLKLSAAVFQNTQESIVITDADCRIVAINPAFTKVTEYSAEEVLGKEMRILQSGRHDRSFYQQIWESILITGDWEGEIWNRRKSGDIYKEWLAISTVPGPDGKAAYYVGIGIDLSRMNRTETDLERLAHHDALTGLPNRLLLTSRLAHTLERAQRDNALCAVMFLDLDRFKAVNDTLGHAAGDELLKLVTERMNRRLRDVDTLARLGGDEFVIVLEGVASEEDVAQVASALIDELGSPFILNGNQEARIGTSVGISIYPRDGSHTAELLEKADQALYAAKHAGRNTWRFSAVDAGQ